MRYSDSDKLLAATQHTRKALEYGTKNVTTFPRTGAMEKIRLVECITLLKNDNPEDTKETLDYIGRLFAFGFAADTCMLALNGGDSDSETYELRFSFVSEERKSDFLRLVREDGYVDPDDDLSFNIPSPVALKDSMTFAPSARSFLRTKATT